MTHHSDSRIQRDAEPLIRAKVAEHVGRELSPASIPLGHGTKVQVDGVAEDETVFVEIFAHQGPLRGGQRHKVAQDALKLITIGRTHPDAELILAFADDDAAAYASKGTWVAEALSTWGVSVLVVELDESVRDGIKHAQVKQEMVNPAASPPPAE
jgi:hypothetical protein